MCGVFIDREMANEIEAGSVVLVSETAPLPNQRGGVFIEKEPNQIVLPSAFMLAAIVSFRAVEAMALSADDQGCRICGSVVGSTATRHF